MFYRRISIDPVLRFAAVFAVATLVDLLSGTDAQLSLARAYISAFASGALVTVLGDRA